METIFISGTGRCGTTILRKILAHHSKIFSFPFESRFIIDPDGVVSLYESLPDSWSPFSMDTRLKRFEKLFKRLSGWSLFGLTTLAASKLINRHSAFFTPSPYARLNLGKYNRHLLRHVKALEKELGIISYNGTWFGDVQTGIRPSVKYCPPFTKEKSAPVFRRFIENIMTPVLREQQATHWVDDTPLSLLSAASILEILPRAKFIHIYRDPRDVVASYRKQSWAPADTGRAVDFYRHISDEIEKIKKKIPGPALLEISLEELVKNPRKNISDICRFIGLSIEDSLFSIKLNRSNPGRWRKEFSDEEQEQLIQRLGDILKRLNYEIEDSKGPGKL
ncbi:MAG: sulfotransferase [bacterium]|nr:sulfotransferase [bacterium]